MLGGKSVHADECYKGEFIGTDFGVNEDLTGRLPDNWKHFNQKYIPVYLKFNPSKSKVTAGLACGAIWTVSKGINVGDIVLCPNGEGAYYIGEVCGDYQYAKDSVLPHRRKVRWYAKTVERSIMSEALRNSTGSIGKSRDTLCIPIC
jgi:restriction system protein